MNLAASIVPLTVEHWSQAEAIYAAGISTGHATFEAEPPTWEAFETAKLPGQRLVAVDPAGRAGLDRRGRVSTAGSMPASLSTPSMSNPAAQAGAVGRLLLDGLVASTEAAGIRTIQSGVFPENVARLKLHQATGFEVVGIRRRLGHMSYGPFAGQWRDVIMIERRSAVTGR